MSEREDERKQQLLRECPNCGSSDRHDLQRHSKTAWCMRCGWARNFEPDPDTGRVIENPGRSEWRRKI